MRQLSTGIFLLPLLSAFLGTTACRTTGYYRVVDLPESPARAQQRVRAELEKNGYEVETQTTAGRTVKLVAVQKKLAPTPRAPARPPVKTPPKKGPPAKKKRLAGQKPAAVGPEKPVAPSRPARVAVHQPPPPPERRPALTATLHPEKGGTRVLLHASCPARVESLLAAPNPRVHKVGFGLNGPRLLWELHAATGYRYAPGYGHGIALEAGARLGYRVIRLGGGSDRPEPGVELALAAGLGGGVSNTDKAGYAMPSLTLSYLIRRTLEPIPGKVIPVGPELSIDLHAVALLGQRRRGLEGQLVFRYGDIGGLYVGAGYQWLPTRGATFTAGLYLSTIGAATAALIAALIASI